MTTMDKTATTAKRAQNKKVKAAILWLIVLKFRGRGEDLPPPPPLGLA
jgi:hypothetical protein